MNSQSYLNLMLGPGPEAPPPIAPAPWDMTAYMRHVRVCDTFLKVAEETYSDLLPRVRDDLARAMSFWLMQDGYRADIEWRHDAACFVGRIKLIAEHVVFSGATPSDLQQAFKNAVKTYTARAVLSLPAPSSVSYLDQVA